MGVKTFVNKKNKGFSLIMTIIVIVLFAALGTVGLSLLVIETHISVDTVFSSRAFFIAESGLQYFYEYNDLANNSNWTTGVSNPPADIVLGNGTFTVTNANPLKDQIDVISKGEVTGWEGEVVIRYVRVTVERGALTNATECFKRTMHSFGTNTDFHFSTGTINGHADPDYGDVASKGAVKFEGGMTFVNSTAIDGSVIPSPVPDPFSDLLDDYKAITPAGNIKAGGYTFTAGTYGSPGNEQLYYIEGNVNIDSNVTIYGSVIAENNITLANSNIVVDAPSGYPAFVADNNVEGDNLAGNSTISGLIYADNQVTFDYLGDNVTINGTILSGTNTSMTRGGNFTINYDIDIYTNIPRFFATGTIIWKESCKAEE